MRFVLQQLRTFELLSELVLILTVCFVFAIGIFGQSGRIREKQQEKRSQIEVVTPQDVRREQKTSENHDDVIRVESILVPIPVSVTDKNGNFVSGLKRDDFLLEDNGKPVEIESVSISENLPLRIALLFDNSSSISSALDFEKKVVKSFLRKLVRTGIDMASLFSISTTGRLEHPLTGNVSSLISTLENLGKPSGATALFDTVIQASEYLRDFNGKRVILIVSDGDDNISNATLEDTIRTVLKNDCVVYVIMTSDFENFKRTGRREKSANVTFLMAERRMQKLSLETGGAVYSPFDENEMQQAFQQISSEILQQYILNYYPEVENFSAGGIRNLSVRVRDRSDLALRFRKSYYLPDKVLKSTP
ncbi:MAG: VWA domain-containing protein [Pyrinomonadaceae bacterium]|nr:VWA domain-containing protein [Pyrinomonadaceae bacterium]